jgi:hypothetical protein
VRRINLFLPVLVILTLVGCKVEIEVPEGGDVVTESGAYRCLSGKKCIVDVTDIYFDETFIARPKSGYAFAGWEKQRRGLCGGANKPCHLFTSGFEGKDALLDILASDDVFFLTPVFQTSPPTPEYNVKFWENLSNEIDSGKFTSNSYLYRSLPNVTNCDPGELKVAPKARARVTLNEIRKLHRLPPVVYDSFYDSAVQSAALVQHANNYINHYPEAGDRCYSELAASGSSSSNIGGRSKVENDDPANDILSWTHDRNNISTVMGVGHRRWVLYPGLGYITYGQVLGESVQKTFRFGHEPLEYPSRDLQFVAFPYQTYPYFLVKKADKPTPWSLSLTPSGYSDYDYEYFRNAEVTVADSNTGIQLGVHSVYTDNRNAGTPNILSWLVDGYEYDKTYRVRISNITYPDGQQQSLEYYVHLDYYNIVDITEPLEAGDRKDGNQLKGSFANSDDKDSYSVTLSGNKRFKGENEQFSNQAFYVLVYDARKRLIASYDEAFQQNFEAGEYTVVASLCDEGGVCYKNVKNYTITIN